MAYMQIVKQILIRKLNKETGYSNSEHMTLDLMLWFESSHWNDSLIAMQHLTHCQVRVGGLCHWKSLLKKFTQSPRSWAKPTQTIQCWCILGRPCRFAATTKKGHKQDILCAVFQLLQFLHMSAYCKLYSCNCDFYSFAKSAFIFFAFHMIINKFLWLLCLNSVTQEVNLSSVTIVATLCSALEKWKWRKRFQAQISNYLTTLQSDSEEWIYKLHLKTIF